MKKRIVICGGGVAGAGLAAVLSNLAGNEISITLLEKESAEDVGSVKRGEVIRPEATRVLTETGLLEYVVRKKPVVRQTPLQEVWHSRKGMIGTIDYGYLAKDYPMLYLPHRLLVQALHEKLKDSQVECVYGVNAQSIGSSSEARHTIHYNLREKPSDDVEIRKLEDADLVVVAEGAASPLRDQLGVETDVVDYRMGYSMVILDKPSELTWGRHCLSEDGFVGLFSMPNNQMRAAIEIDIDRLREWNSYSLEQVKEKLQKRVPYLSDLRLHNVGIFYRIIRRQAKDFAMDGIALIGDAAHTTHPMLGQGMSMVFNDVSALSKLIVSNSSGPFDHSMLKKYEKEAKLFSTRVITASETMFLALREVGKDINLLESYMPTLNELGFSAA